jgi:FG-GAP-like repeat
MHRRSKFASLCVGLLVLATGPGVYADPVTLPQTLTGGGTGGSTWIVTNVAGTSGGPTGLRDLSAGVAIEDGTLGMLPLQDSFDNGLVVFVDGTVVSAGATDLVDRTGQTITVPAQGISGLNVTLQYRAVASSATLRAIVTLANPTADPIVTTVTAATNVGADAASVIDGTSNGDVSFTTADRWVVTSDSTPCCFRPAIIHVLAGPGATGLSTASTTVFQFTNNGTTPVDNGEGILGAFNVTVPGGATRSLMFFTQLHATAADALTGAAAFDSNPTGELVADLTAEQLAQLVNFDFGGGGTTQLAQFDYDGDGKSDIAVYRGSSGEWFIRQSSDGALMQVSWGAPFLQDRPVSGDFDGDGKTDIAVYRGTSGEWFIQRSSDSTLLQLAWGSPAFGDLPASADYDGDGKSDIGVYRNATGEWLILQSSDSNALVLAWGAPAFGDAPVAADFDGDGKADVAVYRRSTGEWLVNQSSDGSALIVAWGAPSLQDIPVPADFDGDGKADLGVYRNTTGEWLIRQSTDFNLSQTAWGAPSLNDIPLQGK